MKYTLSGDPIALQRPRFRKDGATYDPQSYEKKRAALELKLQHRSKPLFTGPLELVITFFMKIPKSRQKSTKPFDYHHCKPDLSNLIKFVEDVANDILYADDALIASITSVKYYDSVPRTEFIILPLQKKESNEEENNSKS